jgi:hypothetical protein
VPTKIESSLSPEQFLEFCRECARMPGGTTLRVIQALAKKHGISISPPAAAAFRDGPLEDYLAELKSKREMAEQVSAVAKDGLSLSDATARVLTQKIFDQSLAIRVDDEDALKKSGTLTAAYARLRLGDQRARKLEADLAATNAHLEKLTLENDAKIKVLLDGLEKQAAVTRGGKLTGAQIRAKIKEVYGA